MSLGRGPRRYCSVVTGSFFGGTSPSCKKSTYYLFTSLLFIIQVFSTSLERVRIFFFAQQVVYRTDHTLLNLLYFLILRTVSLSGTFVVPLMPENSNEFKNEPYVLSIVIINQRTRNSCKRLTYQHFIQGDCKILQLQWTKPKTIWHHCTLQTYS